MVLEALSADDVVVRGAVGSADKFERTVVAVCFPFTAPFAGDGVLPATGGVAVLEGGGVGLTILGLLSQASKKSSDFRLFCCSESPSSATTWSG